MTATSSMRMNEVGTGHRIRDEENVEHTAIEELELKEARVCRVAANQ
jgi:hypothetical protein